MLKPQAAPKFKRDNGPPVHRVPLQLFDATSSTYTYILLDEESREAIIIDPVDEQLVRDAEVLRQLGCKLRYCIETRTHADHITSTGRLIQNSGALAATPSGCGITIAALQLQDGDTLKFGNQSLRAIHTPGHTAGSMSFLWNEHLLTGDTLLIGGCGRTDFQSGSADALYDSLTLKLLTLPDATIVWPGHDYQGQTSSTVLRERQFNLRLTYQGVLRTKDEFITLMNHLNLPRPTRMDEAVPANRNLGLSISTILHG
jgi:sulfur dioxygenase